MGSKGELPNAHIRIEWAGGVLGDFVFLVDESGGLCPREKKESFCICIFADTISGVFLELIPFMLPGKWLNFPKFFRGKMRTLSTSQ